MKDFKFKTVFSSVIKPVVSRSKDLFLAQASLQQLRSLIPNIDIEVNYDLLPVAIPLFNVNYFNKNDDGLDTNFALKIYKSFINKQVNLEHNRDKVIGVILSAHITEFGTDKPLTEDDVKDSRDVFNITVGAVLWKILNEELVNLIEDSNNILSDSYNKIKASLEVGFTDYNIVVCPPNSRSLAEGRLVKDSGEFEKLSANLKVFGGNGKTKDGSRVYRLLGGEGLGLGCGITESPAAELNPIAVKKEQETDAAVIVNVNCLEDINKSATDLSEAIKQQSLNSPVNETRNGDLISQSSSEDLISHSEKPTVINNNLDLRKHMKINSLKEITDDLLKEAKASSIVEFVENELKVASEKFSKEKHEKELMAQEIQKKHDELIKTHEQLLKDLETLKANLNKLEQEKAAKEKQEKFNVRMAGFENKYELTEDELSVIASQIKDLDDEQYKKVEANLHILLKNKDKQVLAEQKKLQETKASTTSTTSTETKNENAQETVDKAIETAKNVSKEVAATSTITNQTLKDKYAKAFAPDQFVISK